MYFLSIFQKRFEDVTDERIHHSNLNFAICPLHFKYEGEIDFAEVCDKSAGEALMHWLYFGTLPAYADVEAIFVLAAYADVSSLVIHAGERMIAKCDEGNVAHIQTLLTKHSSRNEVRALFFEISTHFMI